MSISTSTTIRVTAETKARLGQLASDMRRSRSVLAAEAVTDYIDREHLCSIKTDIRKITEACTALAQKIGALGQPFTPCR
jgi:predicted transcriptional regulator